MSIVVFGDSITNHSCDDEGGWTSRLQNLLISNHSQEYAPGVVVSEHSVMELGIGGDTIVGISKRFENELDVRIEIASNGDASNVLVGIAVGINDSRTNVLKATFEVDEEIFVKTYREVIARLKDKGVEIFLVGLTPVDENRTRPVLYSYNLDSYFNDRIEKYDSHIKTIANDENIAFVDLYPKFQEIIKTQGTQAVLFDGLHPNPRGHKIIADRVYETIKPKLV